MNEYERLADDYQKFLKVHGSVVSSKEALITSIRVLRLMFIKLSLETNTRKHNKILDKLREDDLVFQLRHDMKNV